MIQSKKCVVKILDDVNCVLVGLHQDHVDYFYEEFAFYAANYYFNPKFKLGRWDGKIRYFHKTGKTFVNMLDDIIPKVVGLGYKINVQDNRKLRTVYPEPVNEDFFSNTINQESGQPWVLRNYQVEIINSLLNAGSGVAVAGTGAGKTCISAALALSYEKAGNLKSLIIVPDKNLTEQTRREYAFFGLDVGEYSGEVKDYAHMHVVSTWQSLQRNPHLIQQFDVIIVDECHGLRATVLTRLMNEYGKDVVYRFGVTGTLPKEKTDALAVQIAIGNVQCNIQAHELIEQGYLAKLHIDIIQHEVNLKSQYQSYINDKSSCLTDNPSKNVKLITYQQFKDEYFPDWQAEKQFLQQYKERLEWIKEYIEFKRDEGKGNVLCLVGGVEFGKKLAKMIDGAQFIYGQDKMKVRRQCYDLFKTNNNLVVIATVHIASTGLDIKRIFNLMYIDVGRSFIRTIQTIGRGMRKAQDKDTVHVTDICSDLKYSKRHLRERIKFYKEAKYPNKKSIVDFSAEISHNYSNNKYKGK